ncbi:MAG TPA: VWA domain-containing protein [Thermoanaerobaculia bacterium]|nr:VWA domain-containing protein [Thermoanaerobaculia bacterium]
MRLRFLAPGFLLLAALPLFAQSVRDSVTIEVVDVPVYVTRGSQPVEGLTRDDFELYVNGKLQAIDYFDVVGAAAEADAPESLRERRMFLLLFDLAFSPPHMLGRTQRAAAELIARAPESDFFAVATFSSRRGVWFATPFTRDRVSLARAIGALSNTRSGDPLSIVMSAGERESLTRFMSDVPERSEYFNMSIAQRISGEALRDIWAMESLRAAENQVLDFNDLAKRLAVLQGQKHVVLLSGGFDAGSRTHPWEAASAARNASFTYEERFPQVSMWGSASLHRHLQDMHRAFQAGDILLHSLDVKGLQPYFGNDALNALASGTGGRFLHNRNDLKSALVDITKSVSGSYVLGFRPADVKRGHNKITVKMKDRPRGVAVRHRKGFSGTPQRVDIGEGLYLADVVLNDVPQSGTAAALEIRGNTLRATVPMKQVAAQLEGGGSAHLLVYVFNENGVGLAFYRQTIEVKDGAVDDKTIDITLPDGARVAKALLAVDESLGFSKVTR